VAPRTFEARLGTETRESANCGLSIEFSVRLSLFTWLSYALCVYPRAREVLNATSPPIFWVYPSVLQLGKCGLIIQELFTIGKPRDDKLPYLS